MCVAVAPLLDVLRREARWRIENRHPILHVRAVIEQRLLHRLHAVDVEIARSEQAVRGGESGVLQARFTHGDRHLDHACVDVGDGARIEADEQDAVVRGH